MQQRNQPFIRPDIVSNKRNKRSSILTWLLVLTVVIIILVGLAMFINSNESQSSQNIPETESAIISAVSKHYVLPTDEQPALATVTDKTKLNSTLAKRAQDGDRILIYQKNQQAIIYRPSLDKIVDVTPVQIDTPKQ